MIRNRCAQEMNVSQAKLLKKTLHDADMTMCHPVSSPFDITTKLTKHSPDDNSLPKDQKTIYSSIVGQLMYVLNNAQLDLCAALAGQQLRIRTKRIAHGCPENDPGVLQGYSGFRDHHWRTKHYISSGRLLRCRLGK